MTNEELKAPFEAQMETLKAELLASQAQVLAMREALEAIASDNQCTIDLYEKNGPTWTSRESGEQYYDASFVINKAQENVDQALSALTTPAPAVVRREDAEKLAEALEWSLSKINHTPNKLHAQAHPDCAECRHLAKGQQALNSYRAKHP